ncbi:MAG: SH3 domain-containing protein [Clostridia bacterium]|nr:SH3 domain-containing protein [Clostridia bacterium]
MKKRLFALILAGLLLLTATACSSDGDGNETTTGGTNPIVQTSPIVNVTDDNGNPVTDDNGNPVTEQQGDDEVDDSEFESFSGTIYVGMGANIRKEPSVDSKKVGSAAAGDTFKATAENGDWYKITVDGETCYITKQAAIDKAVMDSFEEIDDEVVVTAEVSLNLRVLPSSKAKLITSVSNSTKLKRLAVGDGWSLVLYTDKNGKTTECYLSNKYIKSLSESATTAETTAEETTAAETENLIG